MDKDIGLIDAESQSMPMYFGELVNTGRERQEGSDFPNARVYRNIFEQYVAVGTDPADEEIGEYAKNFVDRKTAKAWNRDSLLCIDSGSIEGYFRFLDFKPKRAPGLAPEVFDELSEVFEECREPDWDGYDALRVLPVTYENARRFLKLLRLESSAPTVGAEPDGCLTFEWHSSARRTLSVSIAPDGNLHYAAILGAIKRYGTEPIGSDSSAIEDLARHVVAGR